MLVCDDFVSCSFANELIESAEAWVGDNGGWDSFREQDGNYREATVDLEVDRLPCLRQLLIESSFVDKLKLLYDEKLNCDIAAFDDLFLVKYDAHLGQRELQAHVDAADVSFILTLNNTFEGGGTYFVQSQQLVRGGIGSLLVFPSHMRHEGRPITKGVRYLLVGFCFVTASNRSNVLDLELRQVLAPFPAQVYDFHSFHISVEDLDALAQDGGSYWIDNIDTLLLSPLEAFCLSVVRFHCGFENGGAEFWVRHQSGNLSIDFHQDREEHGNPFRHPLLATVTYFSNNGAPTVVLHDMQSVICYPKVGRHLAFKGDLMHGCPSVLAADSGGFRTTLLINIWNERPEGVEHLPLEFGAFQKVLPEKLVGAGIAVAPMYSEQYKRPDSYESMLRGIRKSKTRIRNEFSKSPILYFS